MKLNLGCGQHLAEGWVNIDKHAHCLCETCVRDGLVPDVITDIRTLPYEDQTVDAVYCGHVLEHLPEDEVVAVLREIKRALKADGRFAIVGPDFDRAVGDFAYMASSIWPGQAHGEWDGEAHAWCPTAANTLALVREVFPEATEVPVKELDRFWPTVAFLEWQFAVVAQ